MKRLVSRVAVFGFALAIMMAGSFFVTPGMKSAEAATVGDCSDVFTPLSSFVTDGVNANKSFYVQAMNETGVPWEMLAAIHYRETNFSHTNPQNGQGIFQFSSGAGGPYPPGPVSDSEFYRQLKFMATQVQTDYVYRNSPNPAANVTLRPLTANEQDINLIKNTLYSYNGRSSQYAQQAAQYGYDPGTTPYEGSPYVMNRFDCPRARMGIITQDYGNIDSTDTRYGTFTIFARLRGDSYWLAMTQAYSWIINSQELYNDPNRSLSANPGLLAANTTYYVRVTARNIGSSTWTNSGSNPVLLATNNPSNRDSQFCNNSWPRCSRAALLKEASVAPGEIGTFEFSITTPANTGTYREYFNLVSEGKAWMNDIGMYYQWTIAPPTIHWQPSAQELFTDSGLTTPANPSILNPNTRYYARMRAINTGNTVWTNSGPNPVLVGTANPTDRSSAFCDSSWISCNRPTALQEASVKPGETGTFVFSLKTPGGYHAYKEYFNLVSEGRAWMNDVGLYYGLATRPPTAEWQYAGQAAFTDSTKSTTVDLNHLANNTRFYVTLSARNTGNTTWSNTGSNPVRLGSTNPTDRSSVFCDSSWISCNRPTALDQASVTPGQTGSFSFWMQAPYGVNGTSYKEYFKPVVEGSMWMNDVGLYWPITLQSSLTAWQYLGQSSYTDAAHTQPIDLTNAQTNTTYYLELRLKNTSGGTWTNSNTAPMRLGTSGNQTSPFCDSSWIGSSCNRMALLKEATVNPGQTGTFDFSIHTPSSTTNSKLYAVPVIDGQRWMDDIGLYWPVITH